MESEQSEDWVYKGSWSLVFIPEGFLLDNEVQVEEMFEDLIEIGADDHVQYPTAVFYRGSDAQAEN